MSSPTPTDVEAKKLAELQALVEKYSAGDQYNRVLSIFADEPIGSDLVLTPDNKRFLDSMKSGKLTLVRESKDDNFDTEMWTEGDNLASIPATGFGKPDALLAPIISEDTTDDLVEYSDAWKELVKNTKKKSTLKKYPGQDKIINLKGTTVETIMNSMTVQEAAKDVPEFVQQAENLSRSITDAALLTADILDSTYDAREMGLSDTFIKNALDYTILSVRRELECMSEKLNPVSAADLALFEKLTVAVDKTKIEAAKEMCKPTSLHIPEIIERYKITFIDMMIQFQNKTKKDTLTIPATKEEAVRKTLFRRFLDTITFHRDTREGTSFIAAYEFLVEMAKVVAVIRAPGTSSSPSGVRLPSKKDKDDEFTGKEP